MTAPNVVSLKQAGQSVTIGVTKAGPSQVGNYPEMEITGLDGDQEITVRMPRQSADRQLTRLGITDKDLPGKIVTISRDPNKQDASKPYWGMTLAGEFTPPKSNGHAPVQTTQAAPAATKNLTVGTADMKLQAVFILQDQCFQHALFLADLALQAGVPTNLEGVSALCAQAFIEAGRRGIA